MSHLKVAIFLAIGLLFLSKTGYSSLVLPHLTSHDIDSFKNVFEKSAQNPQDLASAFYGVAGLKLLGATVPDNQKLCKYAQSEVEKTNVESLYHASGLAAGLSGCKVDVPGVQSFLEQKIAGEITAQDLYYVVETAKNYGIKLDAGKVSAALTAAVKKDDTAASLGYAFHAALLIDGNVNSFFDRIEDTVAQADEVDGKYLQFEGGLSVTAVVVSGIYTLADKINKTPNIKADEAIKLANFILSRKGVKLVRPAYHSLNAIKIMTTNKYHVPVSFTLASNVAVSASDSSVRVKICNVLGQSVGPLTVTVDSATHVPSSGVVLNKKAMTPVAGDNMVYQFTFLDTKREKGFYKLLVSAGSQQDKRLVATQGAELSVKVMTEMHLDAVEISVVDREQTTTGKVQKAQPPNKLSGVLEADQHQKLLMKFKVADKATGEAMKIHQAFVAFVHQGTNQEIIFVAEPDAANTYKFDVDLQKSAKDFDYLSGKYQLKLFVGDAVVSNPLSWLVGDVSLKFSEGEKPKGAEPISYEKKPEIQHMFRQPEKRPPGVVSSTFTILVLAPFLILFVLWLRIGVNISNFPFSLYALGFHIGLAGIFGLYFVFWVQLNMFQTLKYLTGIAGVTFICGNAMLKGMAERRKGKAE